MIDIVLSYDFLPRVGGAHMWLYEIYKRWPTPVTVLTRDYRGHPADVANQDDFDAQPHGALTIRRSPAEIGDINLASAGSRHRLWQAAKRVHQLRRQHGAVLHCLRAFPEGFVGLICKACHFRQTRLVVYAHGEEILVARTSRQLKFLAAAVFYFADLVIVNSESTKALVKTLCRHAKVVCIHPGVDVEAFTCDAKEVAACRHGWGWPDETIIVTTVARMEARKNHSMVMRAVADLRRDGLPVAYVCCGDGEESENLRKLARDLDLLPWVRFTGRLKEANKAAVYASTDIFAMPSVQVGSMIEGFGMVFLEAAAAGIPSICGNNGGQREAVLDGRTGIVVDGTRLEDVREALRRLVGDPVLRRTMGRTASTHAQAHDWSSSAATVLATVKDLDAQVSPSRLTTRLAWGVGILLVVLVGWLELARLYSLSPAAFPQQAARVLAAPLIAKVYSDDLKYVDAATGKYWIGFFDASGKSPITTWRETAPAYGLAVLDADNTQSYSKRIPFVYESADADYLQAFRTRYRLDQIVVGASDEYGAMLRLGNWMGTRWDHGSDKIPPVNSVCNPGSIIEAGEHGAKFWCEIAARTMVQAATSVSWPARLISASRDGYTWEHAVAELWSNQFDKWFVMDTDFNVVFERRGIPLSAMELSKYGEQWQRQHELTVRSIAPSKASLPPVDLVPFFKYIHVDLRNDWCSRVLRPGSPAGGDRNTWWTARSTLPRILTAKLRVDDPGSFDWKINSVGIYADGGKSSDTGIAVVRVRLGVYSPVFRNFQIKVDGLPWKPIPGDDYELPITPGEHVLRARIQTTSGFSGPESQIVFKSAPS